jgi:hypothetical protein
VADAVNVSSTTPPASPGVVEMLLAPPPPLFTAGAFFSDEHDTPAASNDADNTVPAASRTPSDWEFMPAMIVAARRRQYETKVQSGSGFFRP